MTVSSFADTRTAGDLVAPLDVALPETPALAAPLRAEFVRYFICSALALAVDFGLFVALVAAGTGYAAAAAIGFVAGLGVAYVLSVRFVFKERALRDARAEFVLFAAIGVVGLALTELLLWLLIGRWHWTPAPAKLITAGLVFCSNFGLRKALLFTRRPSEPGRG